MTFSIQFSKDSIDFLKKSDSNLKERIINKIKTLTTNPVPHNSVRIIGEERTFRIRIGDYRVLYEIFWDKKEILILNIDKRANAYK